MPNERLPNPFAARGRDEFQRAMELRRDRFHGVTHTDVAPEDLVAGVALDQDRATEYRVARTQTVTLPGGQVVTLRRDGTFLLGRYGAAVVDTWVRALGLQLTLVVPEVPRGIEAPRKIPAPEEAPARRGRKPRQEA